MTLSLDSSVVVDLLRRRDTDVRQRLQAAQDAKVSLVLSAVALHELSFGAEKADNPLRRRAELIDFIQAYPLALFDREDAFAAGAVRRAIWSTGEPIGVADLLIGSQALRRGWSVVTSNVRHFGRVDGLTLYDWRVSPEPLTREQVSKRVYDRN